MKDDNCISFAEQLCRTCATVVAQKKQGDMTEKAKQKKKLRTRERIYINKEDEKKSALNTAFLAHKIFFCAKIMKILYQLFA